MPLYLVMSFLCTSELDTYLILLTTAAIKIPVDVTDARALPG